MTIDFPAENWLVIGPELVLTGTALVILLAVSFRKTSARLAPWIALAGSAGAFLLILHGWNEFRDGFHQMVAADNFALFFKFIFLLTAFLTVLLSARYLQKEGHEHGEYYALVLFATVGMMVMAGAVDLIVLFLGLETLSLSVYVLAGFFRTDPRSNEAALKYFLLGAFSTGFLLYGIALVYGAAGSTSLKNILAVLKQAAPLGGTEHLLLMTGMGLLLVGFAFKVASVPFHMWVPDVYEGAPTPVTAFMSVGPKAAGFAAFLRVFFYGLAPLHGHWTAVLWTLAALTMTLGNLVALSQRNIKRMLAYSSIAHAGYILVGVVTADQAAAAGILYYLLAYALMNLGAFGVVIAVARKGEENLLIDGYRGLANRHPWLGAAMALFLFSLAGIPPTAGFVGKFYIFSAAMDAGYIGLAVIGLLNCVLSVYFYLRIIVLMYMENPAAGAEGVPDGPGLNLSPALGLGLIVAAGGTLQLGLSPGFCLDVVRRSFLALM